MTTVSHLHLHRFILKQLSFGLTQFTDLLPAVHRNIFRDQKSLKTAWVKTASELIGAEVFVLTKYTFVAL